MTITDLMARVSRYARQQDLPLIERAHAFSARAHAGQRRASGEEFVQHPLAVALILSELEMDAVTIAAAMLHDVVEDTGISLLEVQSEFGPEVALLVDGVTKLGRLEFRSHVEEQADNLRKMFFAMAEDLRVIIIKLADRLHNMRTLGHLPPERQRLFAQETLEIFAPLAHRLGIWRFKWELEDLAFRYLNPEEFYDLAQSIAKQRSQRDAEAQVVIEVLRERLAAAGVDADIQGRAKNLYSIYRKMVDQKKTIAEIYDLVAVRVIVASVRDCYTALGVVHELWKPIPGRFKDFIAMPKANMYQSLHTTVMGPHTEPMEIQIRTQEMHRTAEYGIAAHWRYKEGGTDRGFDQKLAWLRQVLEWQKELGDAREFMESLKIDLFDDEVFVFTPKGDVIDLPAGATPLDFAYQIHTDVGHRCVGAKVNGKIVPLEYELQNGDIVEILTSRQSAGPSLDWLKLVKTSSARTKIRNYFKRQRREENVARGRELLERELRRLELEPREVISDEVTRPVVRKLNFTAFEDLLAAIAYGGITAGNVAARLRESYRRVARPVADTDLTIEPVAPLQRPGSGIRVRGVDHVLVKFGRCCNPVPGDPVIGYITRGRGVSVHRLDCPNMASYARDPERLLEVQWEEEISGSYPVDITVTGLDRPGLLSEVAQVAADMRTNIISARARSDSDGFGTIDLTLEIRGLEQLERLFARLRRIHDVMDVHRVLREHAR
jgi:GTP pyrophosphokinase